MGARAQTQGGGEGGRFQGLGGVRLKQRKQDGMGGGSGNGGKRGLPRGVGDGNGRGDGRYSWRVVGGVHEGDDALPGGHMKVREAPGGSTVGDVVGGRTSDIGGGGEVRPGADVGEGT